MLFTGSEGLHVSIFLQDSHGTLVWQQEKHPPCKSNIPAIQKGHFR